MPHNTSQNPNSCQPHPRGDHFTVALLEVAIFNNATSVLNVLKNAGLRIKETTKPPYFILEA